MKLTLSQVLPGAGHALHHGLPAELALGADLAGHARDLRGERPELVDHGVDDLRGAQEFTGQRPPVDLERHALREVPLATAPMTRATSVVG